MPTDVNIVSASPEIIARVQNLQDLLITNAVLTGFCIVFLMAVLGVLIYGRN